MIKCLRLKTTKWVPAINATLPARYFHHTTRIIRESQTMIEVHSIRERTSRLVILVDGLVFGVWLRPEPPQRYLLAPCRESKQFQCWVGTSVSAAAFLEHWILHRCLKKTPGFSRWDWIQSLCSCIFFSCWDSRWLFWNQAVFRLNAMARVYAPYVSLKNSDPKLHNKLALQQMNQLHLPNLIRSTDHRPCLQV